jgi:acyl dehydratase
MDPVGRTFDQLSVGDVFEAGPRVISRADIDTFTKVSGDHTALHCDDDYAATTPFGGVVAHGVLNLAAATGLAYDSAVFEGTVLAIRSMDVRFDRPVRPDDQVRLTLEVLELDPRPRADRGRVSFDVKLRNQDDRVVLSGRWSLLVRRVSTDC